MRRLQLSFFALLIIALTTNTAWGKPTSQICLYLSKEGKVQQVNSLDDVPYASRKQARCFNASQNNNLARPQDIKLSGNIRREDISTPLGRVEMRWPRTVETLFGRTPLRSLTDAANTVSRALRASSFPNEVQAMNLNWQIVFMDEKLPETQIPSSLISNCHPGWMTPPANIYIVGQRVAAGCGGSRVSASVADATLTDILVHEIGHAVEYQLLKKNFSSDRLRAEGFASWWQIYAASYSSILDARKIKEEMLSRARISYRNSPQFQFSGSAEDYARAAMYFLLISEKQGVRGIAELYAKMNESALSFLPAVAKQMNMEPQQIEREIGKMLGR